MPGPGSLLGLCKRERPSHCLCCWWVRKQKCVIHGQSTAGICDSHKTLRRPGRGREHWVRRGEPAGEAGAVLSPTCRERRRPGPDLGSGANKPPNLRKGWGLCRGQEGHFPLVRCRSDLHPPQGPSEARLAWALTKPLRAGWEEAGICLEWNLPALEQTQTSRSVL